MNFKKGDRVYFKVRYGSFLEGFGIVEEIKGTSIYVKTDNRLTNNGRVAVWTHFSDDTIEYEYLYNSPLMKALR